MDSLGQASPLFGQDKLANMLEGDPVVVADNEKFKSQFLLSLVAIDEPGSAAPDDTDQRQGLLQIREMNIAHDAPIDFQARNVDRAISHFVGHHPGPAETEVSQSAMI